MNTLLFFSLFPFICFFDIYSGSIIVFEGSPATTINGLTKYVTLRCSLNDSTYSANIIGKRDTTNTTGNVEQVSSIIIMHNNVDIASVAQSHAAKSMVAASNMEVTGDVSSKTGERGFLEVKLHYPTPIQLGEFDCEVGATKPNGHSAIFDINTGINVTQPTIMDSVLYTRDVEDAKDLLAARTGSLEARLTALEKEFADLKTYSRKPPTLTNCHSTGWQNNWDQPMNYRVPSGAILVGEQSYHNDYHEDRRFAFTYCHLAAA